MCCMTCVCVCVCRGCAIGKRLLSCNTVAPPLQHWRKRWYVADQICSAGSVCLQWTPEIFMACAIVESCVAWAVTYNHIRLKVKSRVTVFCQSLAESHREIFTCLAAVLFSFSFEIVWQWNHGSCPKKPTTCSASGLFYSPHSSLTFRGKSRYSNKDKVT